MTAGQPVESSRGAGAAEPDGAAGDAGLDLGGGPVGDDPPAGDHDHPVGDGVGLLQVVGGEDDGVPAAGQPAHRRPERLAALDVHGRGRLVQQQQRRRAGQGEGEQDALALAAGERVDPAVEQSVDAGGGEQVVQRPGLVVAAADQVAAPRPPGLARQAAVLQHRARPPPARTASAGARPCSSTRPAAGRNRPRTALTVDGLARPVGAEQGDGLAGADLQVQRVDGDRVAVADGQLRRCPARG